MWYIVNMVDKNKDYKDFLETNFMRLTMELVEWMEREMVELNKTSKYRGCLLYTSPSPRDQRGSRMPSSA